MSNWVQDESGAQIESKIQGIFSPILKHGFFNTYVSCYEYFHNHILPYVVTKTVFDADSLDIIMKSKKHYRLQRNFAKDYYKSKIVKKLCLFWLNEIVALDSQGIEIRYSATAGFGLFASKDMKLTPTNFVVWGILIPVDNDIVEVNETRSTFVDADNQLNLLIGNLALLNDAISPIVFKSTLVEQNEDMKKQMFVSESNWRKLIAARVHAKFTYDLTKDSEIYIQYTSLKTKDSQTKQTIQHYDETTGKSIQFL